MLSLYILLTSKITIQENVPLAPLTTLKIGGPARYFVKARSFGDVAETVRYARSNNLKLFVLGGGSNILVSDAGFDGLVLQIALEGISVEESRGSQVSASRLTTGSTELPGNGLPFSRLVTAQAGEDWDKFVAYCVDRGLAGIECLSGIPGNVGGTPVQNVGAYGQEVSETIVSVRCLDRKTGEIVDLSNEECGFFYRTSIFNTSLRDRFVVLSVSFLLVVGGTPKIGYKDLKEVFGDRTPSLAETREAVLGVRAAKSMVIDPADPNSRSAGSFFKNPIVSREVLDTIKTRSGINSVPYFEANGGKVKIPAAWLIEHAGFHKGFSLGNAGISTNHSLALVNRSHATAAEIVALKDKITTAVENSFSIELIPEPIFVGFTQNYVG